MDYDIAGVIAELSQDPPIPFIADAGRLRNKSRDYYWYSPILREQLDDVRADLAVMPGSEDDVVRTIAACYERDIPVTVRGAGTGNYGQAMPLRGGVVLRAAQAHSQQEQRMHPSTLRNATLGGFICGGSGGVGSVTWGGLRDRRIAVREPALPRCVSQRHGSGGRAPSDL